MKTNPRQPNPAVSRKTPVKARGLHKHIATGGKPSTYEGCQGVTSATVPGYKKGRS